MSTVSPTASAAEVLRDLLARGYRLSVTTRVDRQERTAGWHSVTYADALAVEGGEPLPDELREAIREHRTELLAAACVLNPPVAWIDALTARYRDGHASLTTLANNVASFIGLHPKEGERLVRTIEEALRRA